MTRAHLLIAAAALALAPAARADPEPAPEPEAAFTGPALAPADVPLLAPVPAVSGGGLELPRPLAEELAAADAGDDPEVEQEVQAESAEMDEVRRAEETAALAPPPRAEDGLAGEAARLGSESPIRQRLEGALGRDTAPGPEEDAGRIPLLPEIAHDLARLQAEYDIPIEVNEAVAAYVRFFQAEPARKHFVRWLSRLARYQERYRAIMREAGLPEDTLFLAMIESGFANHATSRARAVGPWQFIAGTGKRMGLRQDFWVDERRDPEKSARAAAAYLKELHDQFGDWRLAWAGYNAGGGKIARAQRTGQTDFWSMARGRVLKRETKGYVPKLMAAAILSKHPAEFGFRPEEIEAEAWRDYEEVEVSEAAELAAIAGAADVAVSELHELNPELRRSCTPPRTYALKLPPGKGEEFRRRWPAVAPSARLAFARYVVARGEGLAAISAAYGVSPETVVRMNGLKPGRRVKAGTELVIPLSAAARRGGAAPASEAVARARIQEFQRRNPHAVEPEPAARPAVARVEQVAGRTRATVLVQAGDTLWAIAQKFGVRIDELCRWNGIQNPRRHKLQVGSELVVFPNGVSSAAAAVTGPG
jgi:membrane-bound lytic murein transglycosylase D